MGIVGIILALVGLIGIGYGMNIIRRGQVELYRRGQVELYEGQAAVLVGAGLMLAGGGAFIVGTVGLNPVTLAIGLLGSVAFFVMRGLASR